MVIVGSGFEKKWENGMSSAFVLLWFGLVGVLFIYCCAVLYVGLSHPTFRYLSFIHTNTIFPHLDNSIWFVFLFLYIYTTKPYKHKQYSIDSIVLLVVLF